MRTATGVLITLVLLVGLGYASKDFLPYAPVFTVQWKSAAYYIPFNIAGFWACALMGVFASFIQMVRAMLRDAERLR